MNPRGERAVGRQRGARLRLADNGDLLVFRGADAEPAQRRSAPPREDPLVEEPAVLGGDRARGVQGLSGWRQTAPRHV